MKIHVLTPEEWARFSEDAHRICFSEKGRGDLDRVDFAFLAVEGETPLAYATCREHDAVTVYMQHGGRLTKQGDDRAAYHIYPGMLKLLKEMGYQLALTQIENTNTTMLKLAMKNGWLITGVRFFEGKILLNHELKFGIVA